MEEVDYSVLCSWAEIVENAPVAPSQAMCQSKIPKKKKNKVLATPFNIEELFDFSEVSGFLGDPLQPEGDRTGNSVLVKPRTKLLPQFQFWFKPSTTIRDLKQVVQYKTGAPVQRQVASMSGRPLTNDQTFEECKVPNLAADIYVTFRLRGGGASDSLYFLDDQCLDDQWISDLRKAGDSDVHYRGGQVYDRPHGWYRFAINLNSRYSGDRTWLGSPGPRVKSSHGEWPVSYYGTGKSGKGKEGLKGIAEDAYVLAKEQQFNFISGIYSTPSIKLAEQHAAVFQHKGDTYKAIVQNRVNPEALVRIVDPTTSGEDRIEYWIVHNESDIRPYRICVKKLSWLGALRKK